MKKYDPDIAPDPVAWLAMSEGQRIGIVEKYHRAARAKAPRPKAHAAFHAIVENQIAEGMDSVACAMDRLMKEGLTRHDAIHAIASCVAEHVVAAMNLEEEYTEEIAHARYEAALERLTSETWRRMHE